MGSVDHPRPRQRLRFVEVQDRNAVGVRIVVRDREGFVFIMMVADVVASDPLSRAAKGLPVA
jgi:hypothetical protein